MKHNLYFKNKGLIELAAITTMGVSVKESDTAIGQFGTGLKYAIAILLRSGAKVSIYRGMDLYIFGINPTMIRGENFDIITMNGIDLGFTTTLGAHWKMWMAFREIYSNMLDENGEVFYNRPETGSNSTIVCVEESEDFLQCYKKRDEYFLSTDPLLIGKDINIHEGESDHVYYRGIKVYDLNKPSKFTYNITCHEQLTEDRTLAYIHIFNHLVKIAILNSNKTIMLSVITKVKDMFEEDFVYKALVTDQDKIFLEVMKDLKAKSQLHLATQPAQDAFFNLKRLTDKFDDFELDDVELELFQEAINICLALGFSAIKNQNIIFKEILGEDILGLAKDGVIYISKAAFVAGGATKIAGTLIEEYAHILYGFTDESRVFQNWLIDQLAFAGVKLVALRK